MVMLFSSVVVAIACGDDDSPTQTDESAATIAQFEAICSEWQAQLAARGEFPVQDFDPENPTAEQLQVVGRWFESGQPAAAEAIASMRALSLPSEIVSESETLISALEVQLEGARTQSTAAVAGDIEAFKASLPEADIYLAAVKEAAEDLGAENCAF